MRFLLTVSLLLSMTLPVLADGDPIYVIRPQGAIAKQGMVLPQNAFGTTTPPASGVVYAGPHYGLGTTDLSGTVSLGWSYDISVTHDSHYCFVSGNSRPEARAAFVDYWDEPTQKLSIVPKIIGEMTMKITCELRNSTNFNGYNLDLTVR